MTPCTRALSSPTPREKQRKRGDSDHVYVGWLFVEASHAKREFKWRFCVLDGVHFQVYADEIALHDHKTPHARALLVREHLLTHVERMHRLNRGMLLVDLTGYGLWVHGTHDEQYFEYWFALIQAAVLSQPIRLTISTYGFVHQSSDWCRGGGGESSDQDPSAGTFTGWLHVRRTVLRGWLAGLSQRMYCVLSGRRLSMFKLNMEGRWADIHGKIKSVSRTKKGKWLEIKMDSGSTLHVSGRSEDITQEWQLHVETALRAPAQALTRRQQHLKVPLRRILTC